MEPYKNPNSGITHYEIGEDFIKIWFKDKGEPYKYSESGIGKPHVDIMKGLALVGRGLATYISQHPEVRHGYDRPASAPPQAPPPFKH
jgi:hypothetical protein